MAGNISNPPRGLYSLTGLMDMGDVPRILADSVVPTIDITEFLLTNREAVLPSTSAFSTQGFHALVTVPPGELWRIHLYSVECYDLSTGNTATLRTAYTELSGAITGLGPTVSVATSTERRLAMMAQPFWAVPGSRLGIYIEVKAGAGSLAAQASAIISRLRI